MSLLWVSVAALATLVATAPSPKSLKSDLTILLNNDLQGPDSPYATSGVILLGRRSYGEAAAGCEALGEQLWAPELNTASIQPNLDYLRHQGRAGNSSTFWIARTGGGNATARAVDVSGAVVAVGSDSSLRLPALCTQTAPYSSEYSQDVGARWQVSVDANNQTLTGFRDRLSFRFLGIRFAPQPKRFTYSTQFSGSGESASALAYGPQCFQGSSGSEDCLFLNIWTPYLPNPSCGNDKNKNLLRPVAVWIYGGGFTSGTANDAIFDGGNFASRGDVVQVAISYRLSTLGFLALDDGVTNGNYALSDQVRALDWVRTHIRAFGGDPDRITIFGQSAGAGSVRALMASPQAAGKFAGAIPLSNLGGLAYGATYSRYYTIAQQANVTANAILAATNCTAAPSQVDCLRALPASKLTGLSTVARYLVVDGTYLTAPALALTGPRLPVHLMMGTTRDDGAAIINYPQTADQAAYLASQGFTVPPPALFPLPTGPNATLNLYNASSRLATDGMFRCVDQATVYTGVTSGRLGAVYYYEFDRTYQTTGWPGTDVCKPPPTSTHSLGDPSRPYFKCHSGELYYVFGNLARQGLGMRDDKDLPFQQLVLDSFAAFVRTYDPNPDSAWLRARGYTSTLAAVEGADGVWLPSQKGRMTMRVLDWPARQEGFREVEQCAGLGLGVESYYAEG
ncbi:Alpha/Beta hydrolase protein [Podospora appendiculata]|uniref:Carboxylic ester hydrolase n=1 Tax=Podospora appendiculata TaxID=314037 RepID=A0AAE1CFY0_9PEZI|nr:Alpha/Beta hydrolase protein [Podospora appendiculata]